MTPVRIGRPIAGVLFDVVYGVPPEQLHLVRRAAPAWGGLISQQVLNHMLHVAIQDGQP